jgi:hypothetical protein
MAQRMTMSNSHVLRRIEWYPMMKRFMDFRGTKEDQ